MELKMESKDQNINLFEKEKKEENKSDELFYNEYKWK